MRVVCIFLVLAGLLPLFISLVKFLEKWRTCARTEYRFFADRLEYEEGFWTVERKVVEYRNVVKVYLRRGLIQQRYGLGTITLATSRGDLEFDKDGPVLKEDNLESGGGLRLADIRCPEQVLEQIQELIRQSREQA